MFRWRKEQQKTFSDRFGDVKSMAENLDMASQWLSRSKLFDEQTVNEIKAEWFNDLLAALKTLLLP
jgi:hypothetical protein